MKIPLLDLENIDYKTKFSIIIGLYLYIMSVFSVIMVIYYRWFNNLQDLIISYIIYFTLNMLGFIIIISNINSIINKYKKEIYSLRAVKEILNSDKSEQWKKINKLNKQIKELGG